MEKTLSLNEQPVIKERNYGIDLLRLVSMLMVVSLHILEFYVGGVMKGAESLTFKGEFLWALEILCLGAVNIYALISGFVGYKSRHKASNIIYLCLQLIFFTLIISGTDLILSIRQGAELSAKDVFLSFFPSIKGYWYFSAYFCLFFFMPILDKIIESASRKSLKIAAVLCFCVFCYNVQPGVEINYADGTSRFVGAVFEIYRTPTGKRYHRDPLCGGKNSYGVSLFDAESAGLTPCQKCAQ